MKELKKEFRWFNIMEYEKEENYLSKRHQEGWKFKRVTFPGVYTFERCESEKVIYQLDYNKEGIKHQMEYVRMFEDCGWEYLTEFDAIIISASRQIRCSRKKKYSVTTSSAWI